MERLFRFKFVYMVFAVFLGFNAMAQVDLQVSVFGSPYSFDADGQVNTIEIFIQNNGDADAAGGVTLNFTPDMFVDPTFGFDANVFSSEWNCPSFDINRTCTYNGTLAQGTSSFLNIGVFVQPGLFNFTPAFNVQVVDNGLTETNLSDNLAFVDIEYAAGSQTDFQVTLLDSQPIDFPVSPVGQIENRTLSFQIENLGPFDEGDQTTVIFDIDFTLDMLGPSGASSSDTAWSCGQVTGQVICDYGGVYFTGLSTTLDLSFPAPDLPTNITNAIGVSMINALGDPNPGNNTDQYDINFTSGPGVAEIGLLKTIIGNPTDVAWGSEITYLVEVNNTGTADALSVDFTDSLPPGVTYMSHMERGSNFICNFADPVVSCNAPNLPNTTAVDGVEITVQVDGTVSSLVTNTASSSFADSDSLDNTASTSFTIQPFSSDLGATKVVNGPAAINQGQPVEFTIGLVNNGPDKAFDVQLVDDIPTGMSFDSIVSENGMVCNFIGGGQILCGAPELLSGNSHTAVISLIADDAGLLTNTVTASSSNIAHFDPFTSDANQATADVTSTGVSADLDVTLDSDLVAYSVGDSITLDLTVHNPFASTGEPGNVSVVTSLPNETVFSSVQLVQAVGWSCLHDGAPTGGNVTCESQGTPLTIGTNVFIDIVALANSAGTALSSTASMTSDFDPNPSNDVTNVGFDINPADADLSLLFTSVSGTYNQGDQIAYEIRVDNPMVSSANPTDVVVDVTLPIEVSYIGVDLTSAPGWFCAHDNAPVGGTVTCDRQGSPFVSFSTHDININVLATTPATNALAQATISSAADLNPVNNSSSQADVINAVTSDFSIVKTVSGTDFAINDTFTYFLEITNGVASTADPVDVLIEDILPNEVSYGSFIVGTNLGTTINCTHDGSTTGGLFSCDTNGTPFAVGEVVTVDINVTAVSASPNVNNSATVVTSTDPNGNTGNNVANSPTVVINAPLVTTISAFKLAQIAGANVTEVAYGSTYDYVLKVDNTGGNDALNINIIDNLPGDVTLVNSDTTGWTCLPNNAAVGGEVIDCVKDAPLAAGQSDEIILSVLATTNNTVTSITNQMTALGDNTGAAVNDTNVVNLIGSEAALLLTQNPSVIDPGDDVVFDVLFTNTGATSLSGVVLDSVLPPDFIYNGFVGDPGVTCAENTGIVNCTLTNPLLSNNSMSFSLELTTPEELVNNQSYDLAVTADALELLNPVFQSLGTNFSSSDIAVSLDSVVSQVNAGETFEHIMQLRNSGNFDLNDITAVFAFPVHAELLNVETSSMNCQTNTTRVVCTNTSAMAVNSLYEVSFFMRSNGSNNVVGTSAAVNADGVSKVATTSTLIVGSINEFANDLSVVKTASLSQVQQQGAFSYFFEVVNLGVEAQSNFTLTDDLPAGVLFQSAEGEGWSCVGTTSLSCQFEGMLVSGAATQLQLDVIAPSNAGLITNSATLLLAQDENLNNNQSSVDVVVSSGGGGDTSVADLSTQITSDVQEVVNTETVSWNIRVTNNGPDAAPNVQIQNTFPVGFVAEEVLVGNGVSCVLLTASLSCDLASLGINQEIQIELNGRFTNGFDGVLMNVVDVSSDAIDPDLSNNQGTTQISVISADNLNADLSLELVADMQNLRQGDVFEMTLRTSNNGPEQAVQARLSADISGLISQVQVMNSDQWVCQANNSSVNCQYPGGYSVGLVQSVDLLVTTQQVVQTSQPINVSAMIESVAVDLQPGNNMASLTNEVSRTPSEDEIFGLFENAVGSEASETVMRTIRNVSSYCARSYFMAIEGLCEDLIASARPENGAAIIDAMEEITPNEVVGQSTSASEMIASQFRNVGSRLSQLRGGGGAGLSVSGLNGRYGNESIPLGMLAYLNQSEEEQQNVSNINDFVSPWGLFVNGTISMGERDATGRELGFDFDTFGLTAGVDYRFSPTKVAGVALGYANFDSEIEDEAEMKSTGFTLTGYGSFYLKDNLYVDARISYGNPDFEQKRRINFDLDNISVDRVATGKTDANQYSVAMSMGYHFNKNAWNITPNASIRYVRTSIDAFQETGAGGFNFAIADQEVKSMVWSLGASVSRAISLKKGIISPQFDFNFSRETENDGGLLEARFINAPDDEIFFIETDEPDRTFGSAGVGLVFIGANGKQAYINYRSIFGLEGFTRGTINLGARFEF